ncbi:MAG: Nif3-like dinuclear metal center hexameric protein [Thermogutta sp.]|uniref:Nif3-like dinuclear metal center hexameric protein n=1 Tax=Thermogutta sp. TaxID=1962930 RepID=UPI0019A81E8C|nr:Nif3-like dinuclear metal center hexameric protein [Thermogutta sp.]MBC7354020.1 Nif3-like dinuclear metal center hexameric protein [Thermogutta sp.]
MSRQPTVEDVCTVCREICPPELAEAWDNTGLLLGDPARAVERIMTCLTLSPRTVAEAIENGANLVISHHPVPFTPLKAITTETLPGWILWQLAAHQIAVFSPHTSFDSAAQGINQLLAERLKLTDVRPLRPSPAEPSLGTGRLGILPEPQPFLEFAQYVKTVFGLKHIAVAGSPRLPVERVAIGCGAAGELLRDAHQAGCQAFVLGETRFHTCVEAEFLGVGLCMIGHYQSERLGVEYLAHLLRERFPQVEIWASQSECDPIRWI